MWVWNPFAVIGTVSCLAAWALAAFVLSVRPDRRQNRRLATVLFAEGAILGGGSGFIFLTDDVRVAGGFQAIFQVGLLAAPWLYLRFISTLDSPLARWLRNRAVDASLGVAAVVSVLVFIAFPDMFITGFDPTWYAPLDAHLGPWFVPPILLGALVGLYGLVVAIDVFRRASEPEARRRAKAFLWAFGIRDGGQVVVFGILPAFLPLPPSGQGTDLFFLWGTPTTTAAFVVVAALGILRTQLFDIDVKIRWTIERSTILAFFAAAAFVASELLENILVGDAGIWLALAAAAGIALTMRGVARRIAGALVPGEDLDQRRTAIYRSACEAAVLDGAVDAREVAVLERLRVQLGLSHDEAQRIAGAVGGGLPAAGGARTAVG